MEKRIKPVLAALIALALAALFSACDSGESGSDKSGSDSSEDASRAETTLREPGQQASGDGLTPAEATVGPNESSNMVPAGGAEPDPAQPPPENPPEGVRTFPATTNELVEGEVDYERTPPTNGDHDPLWQNCGFYEEPVRDEHAVHSLDHGAVWISYLPDLRQEQIDALRSYAGEEYVLLSPYPDQPAPVIATAWRNQLRLDSAKDPRLERFVEQFRVSETAPLSGNGCTGGVGDPT